MQGGQEAATPTARQVTLEVLGNDRPGIVKEISRVVARHGLSILELTTDTREAPMTGGRLFEARLTVEVNDPSDLDAVRADLERIAAELMVDLSWGEA